MVPSGESVRGTIASVSSLPQSRSPAVIGHDPSPVDAGARPAGGGRGALVTALADLVGAGLDPGAALGASARMLRAAVGADATTIYVVDPRRDVLLRAVSTDP